MGIESRIEDFFSQVHFFKLAYGTILKRAPCPLLHSSFSFVDNVVWCVVLLQHFKDCKQQAFSGHVSRRGTQTH